MANSQDSVSGARATQGKSAPTIYDIAALAGVNPSTVSRALSKPGRVSAKTQKIIEDAAEQLNYQVNIFARALPTGRTQTVGLIVSDITNPAYFDIIRGAEITAAARDYTLMLAESSEQADVELKVARRMLASVDGLILASPRLSDQEIVTLAQKKPVVVLNREVAGVQSLVAGADDGVNSAVAHLTELGHQHIAFVAGPERSWMSANRWESIERAGKSAGVKLSLIQGGQPTVEGGREAVDAVRKSTATAVFCFNDLMAIGLMGGLQAAKILVPQQRSIIGFDNIFGSDFTTPPLTTITSPLSELGSWAFERIVGQLLATADPEPPTEQFQTSFLMRGSTAKVDQ